MIRNYLRECADGARILCSREFWRHFRDYYRPDAVAERMERFAVRLRGEDQS